MLEKAKEQKVMEGSEDDKTPRLERMTICVYDAGLPWLLHFLPIAGVTRGKAPSTKRGGDD